MSETAFYCSICDGVTREPPTCGHLGISAVEVEREPIKAHETIPLDIRQRVTGLVAAAERVRKVLTAPSALPETRRRAKDELKAISKEAAAIWSLI